MSKIDDDSLKVISVAQKFVKSGVREDLESFDLDVLKKANYQLGSRDRDTGWREAIQDRIQEIENLPDIIEAKPNFMGVSIDLKALLKRFFK